MLHVQLETCHEEARKVWMHPNTTIAQVINQYMPARFYIEARRPQVMCLDVSCLALIRSYRNDAPIMEAGLLLYGVQPPSWFLSLFRDLKICHSPLLPIWVPCKHAMWAPAFHASIRSFS